MSSSQARGLRHCGTRQRPGTRSALEVVEKHVAIHVVVVHGGRPTAQEGHRAKHADEMRGGPRQGKSGGASINVSGDVPV